MAKVVLYVSPRLYSDSADVQAGLSLTWWHNSKDRFSHDVAHTGQTFVCSNHKLKETGID